METVEEQKFSQKVEMSWVWVIVCITLHFSPWSGIEQTPGPVSDKKNWLKVNNLSTAFKGFWNGKFYLISNALALLAVWACFHKSPDVTNS